jgi:hypothetical protein
VNSCMHMPPCVWQFGPRGLFISSCCCGRQWQALGRSRKSSASASMGPMRQPPPFPASDRWQAEGGSTEQRDGKVRLTPWSNLLEGIVHRGHYHRSPLYSARGDPDAGTATCSCHSFARSAAILFIRPATAQFQDTEATVHARMHACR